MIKEDKMFSHEMCDGVLSVKLMGEIDHHSAVGVRADIDSLIFESRPQKIVLDLSEISFMDSSGLGLIMGRYALARDLGCAMALRSPSVAVMKILTLAGMERMIKIEKDGGKNEEQ